MSSGSLVKSILDTLLPAYCELCGEPSSTMLCPTCDRHLPRPGICCDICSLPLESEPGKASDRLTCGECLQQAPAFNKLISAFVYQDEIAWLINKFKHKHRPHYGKYLCEQLQHQLRTQITLSEKPDIISAVPMHWSRVLLRGFNQAEFLAHYLAKHLAIPYSRCLKKTRRTAKQQDLNRKARMNNLKDVFQMCNSVEGKFVAVIDDVVTTGATAQTIANILVAAGARRVEVWALARTPKHL